MEKRDLKNMALKGIIGGIVLAAGSAEAAMSGAQSYLAASCGAARGGSNYGTTTSAPSASCGGMSAPSSGSGSSCSSYAPSGNYNAGNAPSGYTVSGQPVQAQPGQPTAYPSSPNQGCRTMAPQGSYTSGQPVQSQRYYYNQGQGQPIQAQPGQPMQNVQPTQAQLPKATDQGYRKAGYNNYVADASTDAAIISTRPLTREEFLNHLTEQAKAQFNSLTPDNQKKVVEIAHRVAERIRTLREGAQQLQEKRAQMTKEEFQTYLQDQGRAWFNSLSAENQQKVLEVFSRFAERVHAHREAMRVMQERRAPGSMSPAGSNN